jgi:hypothetical protein
LSRSFPRANDLPGDGDMSSVEDGPCCGRGAHRRGSLVVMEDSKRGLGVHKEGRHRDTESERREVTTDDCDEHNHTCSMAGPARPLLR